MAFEWLDLLSPERERDLLLLSCEEPVGEWSLTSFDLAFLGLTLPDPRSLFLRERTESSPSSEALAEEERCKPLPLDTPPPFRISYLDLFPPRWQLFVA